MNSDPFDEQLTISEQAAAWRVILGAYDSRRLPEFWQWVTRSPEHVSEALMMGLLNHELQHVDPDPRIDIQIPPPGISEQDAPPGETRHPSGGPHRWIFSAAVLAACVTLVLLSALLYRGWNRHEEHAETYTTQVGEQRALTLIDGSTVFLDAESRLQVRLLAHERSFELEGQAFFNVAHDPSRPFRVRTAVTTIEAIGTEFNVRTDRLTKVAVLDGAVRVYPQKNNAPSGRQGDDSSADSSQLVAGEGVSINGKGEITDRAKIDRATVTAWQEHRLVFSRVTLEDIVREFNRYNPKGRLSVEGHAASLRFGGVFEAGDPNPLLLILGKNPSVVVEHDGDNVLIRDRR